METTSRRLRKVKGSKKVTVEGGRGKHKVMNSVLLSNQVLRGSGPISNPSENCKAKPQVLTQFQVFKKRQLGGGREEFFNWRVPKKQSVGARKADNHFLDKDETFQKQVKLSCIVVR